MIFRAANYSILSASAVCSACGQATHVVAIAVPAAHEVCAGDAWELGSLGARLFYVEAVPDSARQRLELLAPWYRPASGLRLTADGSADPAGACWLNHCEHCAAPFDDHDLHCEPGGAFAALPSEAVDEPRILRWEVDEPLEVVAAGCGEDPSA